MDVESTLLLVVSGKDVVLEKPRTNSKHHLRHCHSATGNMSSSLLFRPRDLLYTLPAALYCGRRVNQDMNDQLPV